MTAPAINSTPTPPCPKCGGAVWDQQGSKFWGNGLFKSGKQKPRWECKNKECGGAVWDKNGAPPKPPAVQRVTANIDEKSLPPELRPSQVEREERQALSQKVGFDIASLEVELSRYQSIVNWYVDTVVPILTKTDIGASPESVTAGIATIYIQTGKK